MSALPSKPTTKRDRTRRQLLDAALAVFSRKDPAAVSILEVAAEAGVAHGTIYNYFDTRQEMLEEVALQLADSLSTETVRLNRGVEDSAQRLAFGIRRFVRRAAEDPIWGRVFLRITAASVRFGHVVTTNTLNNLREGKKSGRLSFDSEEAALDLVFGATMAAMRSVVETRTKKDRGAEVARLILRGLGCDARVVERSVTAPFPSTK